MVESGDPGVAQATELLRALLQILECEREAILALDESALALTEKETRRLLEALPGRVDPAALTAADFADLSALLEEARQRRDYNQRLLEKAVSGLESELAQLSRREKNLRAYHNAGSVAEDPAEALFLSRQC